MFKRFFKKATETDSRLEVGILLHLSVFDENTMEESEAVLKSRIADIKDNQLAIEMPIEEGSGKMRFFPKDTELTASFFEEDGMKYSFSTKVVGKANDNIPLLLVERPTEQSIIKIQRRDYLRVPVNLNLTVTLEESDETEHVLEVQTFDLSGGGLSFTSPKLLELENGQMFTGSLSIPHAKGALESVPFTGVIVRVFSPTPERPVQFIAIQFVEIDERSRDRIIRFCLQRELELNRKLNR